MRSFSLMMGLAVSLFGASLHADPAPSPQPAPQRIKGIIAAFDPATQTLNVTTAGKKVVSVVVAPQAHIIYNQRRKLADLKAGDFVGAAALRTADKKLRAQQIVLFPEALRGMGEGQYPMGDPASGRVMTNATVAEVTGVAPNSGTLTLNYHGAAAGADGTCGGHASGANGAGCTGDTEIVVAPGVPVVALMVGDPTLLVPGMSVSLIASTTADGQLQSARLTVEKDGVKPIL